MKRPGVLGSVGFAFTGSRLSATCRVSLEARRRQGGSAGRGSGIWTGLPEMDIRARHAVNPRVIRVQSLDGAPIQSISVKLTFIESRGFTEKLHALVDDDAYRIFQRELEKNPEKGDLIKGAGGVRKVRIRVPGRGKSGGARVIYLYLENHALIYFLLIYTKKEQADLSSEEKKAVSSVVEEIKRAHRNRLPLRGPHGWS